MGKETNLGLGLNGDNIVTSVRESSAAARAGVKLGDVILGWQGRALERERLQDILRPAPVHILSIARGSALVSARAGATAPASARGARTVPSMARAAPDPSGQAPAAAVAMVARPGPGASTPAASSGGHAVGGADDASCDGTAREGASHGGERHRRRRHRERRPREGAAHWASGWGGASGTDTSGGSDVDAAGAVGGGHDDDEGGVAEAGAEVAVVEEKKVNGGRETLSRARAKKREERAPNVGERIADASTDLDGEEEEDVEGGGIVSAATARSGVEEDDEEAAELFRKQELLRRLAMMQASQAQQQQQKRTTAVDAPQSPSRRVESGDGGGGDGGGGDGTSGQASSRTTRGTRGGRGETATPREVVARQHVEHMQKVRKLEEAAVHLAAASPSKRVDATAAAAEDQESHAPYDVIAAAGGAGSASDGSDSDDEDDDAAEEEEEGERGADAADARALEMAREWAASRHLIEAPPGAAAATAAVNERPPPATRRNARGRPPVEAPMARGEGQRPSPRSPPVSGEPRGRSSLSLSDVAMLEREVRDARAEYEALLGQVHAQVGRALRRAEAHAHTELMRRWRRYTAEAERLRGIRKVLAEMAMPGLPPPSPGAGSVPKPWVEAEPSGGSPRGGAPRAAANGVTAAPPSARVASPARPAPTPPKSAKERTATLFSTLEASGLMSNADERQASEAPPSKADERARGGDGGGGGGDGTSRRHTPRAATEREGANGRSAREASAAAAPTPPLSGVPAERHVVKRHEVRHEARHEARHQELHQQDRQNEERQPEERLQQRERPQERRTASQPAASSPAASSPHRELASLLQKALLAARSSPPDWMRVEGLLARTEARAVALCDVGGEAAAGGESAAERVRRAALALRRRRRVTSTLDKVRRLREEFTIRPQGEATARGGARPGADGGGGGGSEKKDVAEAEVLALLTSLLGDEVVAATAAAEGGGGGGASSPSAGGERGPAATARGAAPTSGQHALAAEEVSRRGAQTSREAIDGVMERLDRLRRGGGAGGGGEGGAAPPERSRPNERSTRQAADASRAGQPPGLPTHVPRLALDAVRPECAADSHVAPGAVGGDSIRGGGGGGGGGGGLLDRLQQGLETARQSVDQSIEQMGADVAETFRRHTGALESMWQGWGGGSGGGSATQRENEAAAAQAVAGSRLTRDRGCRSRFSEADWAERVKHRTVGFDAGHHGNVGAAGAGAAGGGGLSSRSRFVDDEYTLGPARPVHELDAVDRYEAKAHSFHFC